MKFWYGISKHNQKVSLQHLFPVLASAQTVDASIPSQLLALKTYLTSCTKDLSSRLQIYSSSRVPRKMEVPLGGSTIPTYGRKNLLQSLIPWCPSLCSHFSNLTHNTHHLSPPVRSIVKPHSSLLQLIFFEDYHSLIDIKLLWQAAEDSAVYLCWC